MSDKWENCYDASWQGEIVPEAFAHPAKFSRSLIQRIYDHAFGQGWIKAGDTVIDPFGGVALGGLDAAIRGVQWVGCELEPKFHALGNRNIDVWQARYCGLCHWRRPILVNGDSRKLATIVREQAAVAVSSPPYVGTLNDRNGIDWEKAAMAGKDSGAHRPGPNSQVGTNGYGQTAGQLSTMSEGSFDGAVSSPPYAAIAAGAGGLNTKPASKPGQQSGRSAAACSQDTDQKYGAAPGQLATLSEGTVDGAISSPPFEKQDDRGRGLALPSARDSKGSKFGMNHGYQNQAEATENIANESGETFWLASRQIIEQLHLLLKPGGHAIFVLKGLCSSQEGRSVLR